MRIYLATEGESDEVVATGILHTVWPDAVIEPKRFPARGISVVLRLLPDTVRGAHFGHYDLLVVHVDLDDTLPPNAATVGDSPRWQKVQKQVQSSLLGLRDCHRPQPVRWALMTPCQSTDAWLSWGRHGGDGRNWEQKSRHELKAKLYGTPPIGMVDQATRYTQELLVQIKGNAQSPLSLQEFLTALANIAAP